MIYELKTAIFIEVVLLTAVSIFRFCLHPRHRHMVAVGDIMLVVMIPLVGLFGHNKNVFYGFLFVAPLFWAGDPIKLAKRYVLALVSFPELSQAYTVGGLYLGSWSALLSLNAGSLIALAMARRGRLKPVRSIDVALWLIFLVALLMSSRGMTPGGATRAVVSTFVLIIPPYFIVSRLMGSTRSVEDMLGFFVLGGVCNACIALVESVKYWSLYESLAGALNIRIASRSANLAVRAGFLRAGGTFVNYEMLGLLCGMALLAAIAVRRRFTAVGFYAIIALLTAGLLASQARSAWIATAVGLIVQAVYDRRWGRVGALVGGAGLAAALTRAVSQHGRTTSELIGTSGYGESTDAYRQRLLDRGLEEARLHPWTGQTLDQLQMSMNDLRQGEHIIDFVNTHLYALLVGGIGGLAAWLVAWCTPFVLGWRGRPALNRGASPSATALPFALLSTLVLFLAFSSAIDRAFPFVAISMGLMSIGLRLNAHLPKRIDPRQRPVATPHGDVCLAVTKG